MRKLILAGIIISLFASCKKKKTDDPSSSATTSASTTTGGTPSCPTCSFPDTVWTGTGTGPKLVFKFKFDSMQVRLNNLGQPSTVGAGNGAQCPVFNGMSTHYIELAPKDSTLFGHGAILYKAPETTCGGTNAIVFCESIVCKEGDVCFSIPISSVTPGDYKWIRVSLAYQNYDVKIRANGQDLTGTIASFVGYNTYVTKYKMKGTIMTPSVTGNHLQGYWGFYTSVMGVDYKAEGQAPSTTVVNPNSTLSPIPFGSCVVTGQFFSMTANQNQPLHISGNETNDIVITISLSTNKSFEWHENTADGLFEPSIGEAVVDMGLRGLIAKY